MGGVLSAHENENTVYPVHVVITVDQAELTAVVRMNAVYMNNAILFATLDRPLPGVHWPAATVARAKTYIEKCFTLSVDGQALTPASFSPRFIQEPLGVKAPEMTFTLRYPVKADAGRLVGHAAFFAEAQPSKSEARADGDAAGPFVTYLSVVGKKTVDFELPIAKPDFEISLDGMARSSTARFLDRAGRMGWRIASSPFFWFALIFIVVQGIKRWKKRKSTA
jgi:hypothetical protein